MRARELLGMEVIDSAARIVGTVRDLDIDTQKWTLNAIIIRAGFIRRKTVPASDIDKVGDKVFLKVTADKIRRA